LTDRSKVYTLYALIQIGSLIIGAFDFENSDSEDSGELLDDIESKVSMSYAQNN
jgi:hypothetical protein